MMIDAMSHLEKPALTFSYSRSLTGYMTIFFLTLLVTFYCLLLLNKDDKQWSFYATGFAYLCLFSLMAAGIKWGRVLLTGARVFYRTQMPVSLWQSWLRSILTRANWLQVIVFCAISSFGLIHQGLFSTSALLAMASLSLAGGFSLSLVFNNYLNKRCYLLLFGLASYLVYVSFSIGAEQWINASWEWHIPAILMWPSLSIGTRLYWQKPPVQKGKALFLQLKEFGLISDLRHFYCRFTDLGSIATGQKKDSLATADKIFKSMGLVWLSLFSMTFIVDWQASVTLPHLIFLMVFAAFSSSYIMVKDLHWRFALRPKGFQRGRIATHLLISSAVYYGLWALILFVLFQAAKMFLITPVTLNHTASISWFSLGSLVIELGSAFCLGLLIRGSEKPTRGFFYLFLTCLVVAASITTYFYLHNQNPLKTAVFNMDLNYLCSIVVIGILTLIYANKLWTRERLLAYL